jgi:hypothetical protein
VQCHPKQVGFWEYRLDMVTEHLDYRVPGLKLG